MAKYTSDASLIKGAARAYKDYSNDPAIYAGLNKAIVQGGKMFEEQMEKRRLVEKKFDDASEGVLMRSGALGDTLYGAATDDVTKLRDMYIKGVSSRDDKMKMKAMSGLQNLSTFVQDHKQTNLDIAKLRSDGSLSSYYEKSGVGKEEANFITQILDQSYSKVSTNKEGEKVFHVEDLDGNKVMVSNKEYKEMASVIKNYETGNGYEKTLDRLKRQEIWNQDGFSQGIKQVLARNKKQWKATAYDDISGTNLTKMLERKDLDQEIINTIDADAWDADGNGSLDSEEKANFIDAVMNVDNKFFKLEVSNKILEDELTRKAKESHGDYWTEENRKRQEVLNRSQEKTDNSRLVGGKRGIYNPANGEYEYIGYQKNQTLDVDKQVSLMVPGGVFYDYNGNKYRMGKNRKITGFHASGDKKLKNKVINIWDSKLNDGEGGFSNETRFWTKEEFLDDMYGIADRNFDPNSYKK